jgi:hypothetical protein
MPDSHVALIEKWGNHERHMQHYRDGVGSRELRSKHDIEATELIMQVPGRYFTLFLTYNSQW